MSDPLSRLCVVRLTQLLELNSVEGLQHLEESSYVAKNIAIEEQHGSVDGVTDLHNVCKQKISPKNQVKKLFKNISRREALHVFGQQVSETTLEMIIQLIDHMKGSASTEGLFRISGNKKRQEELKNIINKHEALHLDDVDCPYNAHDIAGILKYFFSELPEPLLTKSCFVCYQQLAEMDSMNRHKRKVDTLKILFLLLPPLNRMLLKKLIEMLAVVAADATNRMTSFNLGVIFAPNIVCSRKPVGCLSDFTENVEPFTDLVKFIIENSAEVFRVPEDFLEEAKEYLTNIALDDDNDVEVPITRKYCEQIDVKQYTKQAQDNTNQELMLLYSQMSDMPDGPVKRQFLEKFKQSYPGTPIFIPKSVKDKRKDSMDFSSCPATPESKPKLGCLASCSVKKATSENFLDNITKTAIATPRTGGRGEYATPGRSEDNILSTCDNSKKVNQTPSTPTRMKNMYKKFRRRSIELFKPKDVKVEEPRESKGNLESVGPRNRSHSRVRDFFRAGQKQSSWRGLKKSISTPTLIGRRKDSVADDTDVVEKRKLSFSIEHVTSESTTTTECWDDGPSRYNVATCYDQGFVNDAFTDVADGPQVKVQTPVIRKALRPVIVTGELKNESNENAQPDKPEAANTPKILRPSYKGKPVVVKTMGKNKLPLLASKQVRTPFKETANVSAKKVKDLKLSAPLSVGIKNKENYVPT